MVAAIFMLIIFDAPQSVAHAAADHAQFLEEFMQQQRRRPYSLYQLAILAPDVLTAERLAAIDARLSVL